MRGYRPEELFDADGALAPELQALPPEGTKRMGATPYANGGLLRRDLALPDVENLRPQRRSPRRDDRRGHPCHGRLSARRHPASIPRRAISV